MQECIFHSRKHPGEYLKYYRHEGDVSGKMPLLFHLAGAGSRGDELSLMGRGGPLGQLDRGRRLDCLMVAPQCHTETWFELFEVLIEFLEACRNEPMVDQDRVYLSGISMGAYAAWHLGCVRADWLAALVPVCGGGMYWCAGNLKNVPVWAFHGMQDTTVRPDESLHMVSAVNAAGGNAKLTLYPTAGHDAWTDAYNDDELWRWMFSQRRKQND